MDENDPLQRLFRDAGHAVPSRDLTASIMCRVAQEAQPRTSVVRPLIGAKGWATVGLLTLLALVLAGSVPEQATSLLRSHLPSPGPTLLLLRSWSTWAALVPAGILVVLVMERWLQRQLPGRSVLH